MARRYRGGVKFVLVAEGICRMPSEADNECDVAGGLISLRCKSMYPESVSSTGGLFWRIVEERGGLLLSFWGVTA